LHALSQGSYFFQEGVLGEGEGPQVSIKPLRARAQASTAVLRRSVIEIKVPSGTVRGSNSWGALNSTGGIWKEKH
jgi:hypothetical protein